jgi:hypothetical protein
VSKREVRIDITGNADKFGEAAKKAQADINALKSKGLDALTMGVYGGGLVAAATAGITALQAVVVDIKQILARAEQLNISTGAARQLARLGQSTGIPEELLAGGVQQARKARADALQGDDQAVKAFESIGLSLEKIRNLKPDELFRAILETASQQELNAQRYFGYARIIGEQAADATLPIARNPAALELLRQRESGGNATRFLMGGFGTFADSFDRSINSAFNSTLGVSAADLNRADLRGLRMPFEPFSAFGLQNREQTDDAAEINRQKLALVARAQLTTEERINEAIAERLRLNRLIEDEADPLKRQKLIANLLNVEGEIGGLVTKRGSELVSAPSTRTQDPLRAIGADFSTFFVRRDMETGRQQLDELRRLRSTIAEGLQRVERAIGEELK